MWQTTFVQRPALQPSTLPPQSPSPMPSHSTLGLPHPQCTPSPSSLCFLIIRPSHHCPAPHIRYIQPNLGVNQNMCQSAKVSDVPVAGVSQPRTAMDCCTWQNRCLNMPALQVCLSPLSQAAVAAREEAGDATFVKAAHLAEQWARQVGA